MSELPTGTVTFLFTDVEGSTALLRRLRDRYADVLADHQRLLREAFDRAGGNEVDSQGDSFFFCFRHARDAVQAAADGQRALLTYPWPDEGEVRVRIGIHTGEASASAGRYHGLAVHRAKRICDAGHGGQILLSQTSHTLLEDEETEHDGFSLLDLGPHRLKDFDRPVVLHQVVAPDLPSEFPPIRPPEGNAGADALRVVIADDQALVRAGFRMILDAEEGMDVVGEASSGAEVIEEVRRLRPDVVLMDVRMPEMDGIEATRRLLADGASETKVVMLTTFDMDEYVYEALRAGASGFLLKDVPPEQLVEGIRAVGSGKRSWRPQSRDGSSRSSSDGRRRRPGRRRPSLPS